ncbi:UNVERIFIED_ORG: hypothetical protein ABIB19_003080 [Arthrobacter sp. UYEF10]
MSHTVCPRQGRSELSTAARTTGARAGFTAPTASAAASGWCIAEQGLPWVLS